MTEPTPRPSGGCDTNRTGAQWVLHQPGSPLTGLFVEAERQLVICNACRYCEGYCAVFPALELRRSLTEGDIVHLADLCHDCRDCYTACMYAPPHEFAIDPPSILSAIRRDNYDRYLPRLPGGRIATMAATALVALAVLASCAVLGAGSSTVPGSPYRVIAYPALVVAACLAIGWGIAMTAFAAARYWRDTRGRFTFPGLADAVVAAATLRNLRGGGDCSYPGDDPSPWRRRLHQLVAGGFVLCFTSTVAAAISQDILGDAPPYPVGSVPVLLGIAGGAGLTVGCAGLLALKRRAVPVAMTRRDYGLLVALLVLAITGLLTLVLRDTAAFAPVLVIHLCTVMASFAIFPYTKFVHVIYRFLALVHDSSERLPEVEHRDLVEMVPDGVGAGVAWKGPHGTRAVEAGEISGHRPDGVVVLGQPDSPSLGIVAFHSAPAGREQVAHPVPAPVRRADVALSSRLHDGDRPRTSLPGNPAWRAQHPQHITALAIRLGGVGRPDPGDHELIALLGRHRVDGVHCRNYSHRACAFRRASCRCAGEGT
jgi:citrate/tricarballylate utilization protein